MKNYLRSFGARVSAAIIFSLLVIVVLANAWLYQFTLDSQFESVRSRLKVIAQTAALLVDDQKVEEIPLSPEGMKTPAYALINAQLKRVKAANSQIQYVYILKKVDESNIWRFVVDATVGDEKPAYPGRPYDAGRFPAMLKAFDQSTADKKIETDEWGKTVSGYAPIRDRIGRPVAVIGVDLSANDLYAMRAEVARRAWGILGIGVLLALLMGVLVSRRVAGPVQQLVNGTKYIAQGNLHHQVHVWGDDEISELAESFNQMSKSLQESRHKLLNYFYDTVNSMVRILEIRDQYTMGHSEAVAKYAERIARRMGVDAESVDMFKRVALLHDIGKVGVRDNVLLKPDKLDDEEWDIIKRHPVLGEQILKPILENGVMLSVIRNHHERYDGKGYPDGWAREQIPLLVAIVTVADSYEAMTSSRAYRKAMSREAAMDQLRKGRGTQFHPDAVDTFLQVLQEEQSSS